MAVEFFVNRLKALLIILVGVFRRALCCLRRRRRSSCDSIPLSAVGVISNAVNNRSAEQEHWDQWDENPVAVVAEKPPNLIQNKIEQYRQQMAKLPEIVEEPRVDFFQDMAPKITKQRKILLRDSEANESAMNMAKFAVETQRVPTSELAAWEDNAAGWEEETVEEFGDPTLELREQRRRERERRLYDQHQKRMEYSLRPHPLGEKISS